MKDLVVFPLGEESHVPLSPLPLCERSTSARSSSVSSSATCPKKGMAKIDVLLAQGGDEVPLSHVDAFKLVLEDRFKQVCTTTDVHFSWCEIKSNSKLPPYMSIMVKMMANMDVNPTLFSSTSTEYKWLSNEDWNIWSAYQTQRRRRVSPSSRQGGWSGR